MYFDLFNIQLFDIDKKSSGEIFFFAKSRARSMPEIVDLSKLTWDPSKRKRLRF